MNRIVRCSAACCLVLGVSIAAAHTRSEHGPLASRTGAWEVASKPAETSCTLCHFHGTPNLNLPGGALEILGIPEVYQPGQTYALTVRLASDSTAQHPQRKWGFQITAVRASDGEGAGTFAVASMDTVQIVDGAGIFASRRYAEHTLAGTRRGLAGPVSWSFDWQAPAQQEGTIYFFGAGNAADGNDDPGSDFIYTAADSTRDQTSPARALRWGAVKARFRR